MITKFNLFEKVNNDTQIDINLNDTNLNYIINGLSLNIFKRKNSIKNIQIDSINGYFEKKNGKYKKSEINIKLSNNDKIKGIFKEKDNSIIIYINDILYYDVDYKKFNSRTLLSKIIEQYKNYLKDKKWKIK